MRGRNSVLGLALLAILIGTGVALATPVAVLSISDGQRSALGLLPDGASFGYSYRQSIYDVLVYESFVRNGDRMELRSVTADDIRAIEYYRWDTPIIETGSGAFTTMPPPTSVSELVIRITANGQQRVTTGDWRPTLLPRFGESVVHVRVETSPILFAIVRGLQW